MKWKIQLFFLVLYSIPGVGQQVFCSTFDQIAFKSDGYRDECKVSVCDDSLAIYEYSHLDLLPVKQIPIRWVFFTDDDFTNGGDTSWVSAGMAALNYEFNTFQIEFVLRGIDVYNDSSANHADDDEWKEKDDFYIQYGEDANYTLTIYIVSDFDGNDERGFALFPYDIPRLEYESSAVRKNSIVIAKPLIDPNNLLHPYVLIHEVGHLFGLFHPFIQNGDCDECNEEMTSETNKRARLPYTTGDYIADTYPHPLLRDMPEIDDSCAWLDDVLDECLGEVFADQLSNMQNYMNYFPSCDHTFTQEQKYRMHCFIESYVMDLVTFPSQTTSVTSESLGLYPNPSYTSMSVIGFDFGNLEYSILNMIGEPIQQGRITNNSISITDLSSGSYIIKLWDSSNNTFKCLKFIKL